MEGVGGKGQENLRPRKTVLSRAGRKRRIWMEDPAGLTVAALAGRLGDTRCHRVTGSQLGHQPMGFDPRAPKASPGEPRRRLINPAASS